jgi:hypothetical protein
LADPWGCDGRHRHAGAKLDKRPCTLLEISHPEMKGGFEFQLAQVFIDNEYNLPSASAYGWPGTWR